MECQHRKRLLSSILARFPGLMQCMLIRGVSAQKGAIQGASNSSLDDHSQQSRACGRVAGWHAGECLSATPGHDHYCIWLYLDRLYSWNQPHLLIVWDNQHPSLHDVDRSPVAPSPRQCHQSLHMKYSLLSRQNYNSFQVKKVPEGPIFSTEPVCSVFAFRSTHQTCHCNRVTSATSTRTSTPVWPTKRQGYTLIPRRSTDAIMFCRPSTSRTLPRAYKLP